MSRLYYGDCLPIMRGMPAASVDLIYLDPPFNSRRDYGAFNDTWSAADAPELPPDMEPVASVARQAHSGGMATYLSFMAVRLLEMRRLLKPTGSIYLHCDPTASHYIKAMMDAIFGHTNFRNEIVWKRTSGHSDAKRLGAVHDTILLFTKSDTFTFNAHHIDYDAAYVARRHRHTDPDGRRYMDADLSAKGLRGGVRIRIQGREVGMARPHRDHAQARQRKPPALHAARRHPH